MSKLFSAYGNAFSYKILPLNDLYELVIQIPSLNGLYLALDGSVDTSGIGTNNTQVKTWRDLSGSTNYLESISDSSAPSFVTIDPSMNNNSSINFNVTGNETLRFNQPLTIKTIIFVYRIAEHGSYLIYSPRNTLPPNPQFFDTFPSFSNTIWSQCSLSNNFAYNSTSRINTTEVSSDTFLPLNSPRILSVHNFNGDGSSETILGIGGRAGRPNGGPSTGGITDSVKGNISAILTFSENLSSIQLEEIELALRELYINYTGSSVLELKEFKYRLLDTVSFDFSNIVVDEWSTPATYELLYPSTLNINFNGTVLEGIANVPFEDKITVRITNQLGLQTTYDFPFEINRVDPLIASLPQLDNINLVLSSHRDDSDLFTYGVYADENLNIVKWEDARRVDNTKQINILTPPSTPIGEYVIDNVPVVDLNSGDRLQTSQILGKSFLWVYKQEESGTRFMLDGFSDRRGNGVLWTTESSNEIHGQTDITRLTTFVTKVSQNTLLYKLPIDTLAFITAFQPDNQAIDIYGLDNLKGKLYFLCIWDTVLTESELNNAIAVLADRYVPNQSPFIVDNSSEFKFNSDVNIDLSRKVVDLKNRTLTYNILQNHYNATIANNILSFTAVTDELLTFSIEVTNSDNQSVILTFNVDITLRTNPLYLNIKNYLNSLITPPIVSNIFLASSDSVVFTSATVINEWKDYRLNGESSSASNLNLINSPILGNRETISYPVNGGGVADLNSFITSSNYIIVYVKDVNATGDIFLLGNDTEPIFAGTQTNIINSNIASPAVIFGDIYVNKQNVDTNYTPAPKVMNVIYFSTTSDVRVDSIAQDRVFADRGVKGLVPLVFTLDRALSVNEVVILDSIIRDYYDPIRFVLILHFNNNLIDSSDEAKIVQGSSIFTTQSKFNSHALVLLQNNIANSIIIPNNGDLAYLNEDFTISFWIAITTALQSNLLLSIFQQNGLTIYIKGNSLYIDQDLFESNFRIRHILPNSFYNSQVEYHHIEVNRSRERGYTSLYIDGVLVDSYIDSIEYIDTTTSAIIGGKNTSNNTTNAIVYLDEFIIFKRAAIHTDNFTPPGSEYNT